MASNVLGHILCVADDNHLLLLSMGQPAVTKTGDRRQEEMAH